MPASIIKKVAMNRLLLHFIVNIIWNTTIDASMANCVWIAHSNCPKPVLRFRSHCSFIVTFLVSFHTVSASIIKKAAMNRLLLLFIVNTSLANCCWITNVNHCKATIRFRCHSPFIKVFLNFAITLLGFWRHRPGIIFRFKCRRLWFFKERSVRFLHFYISI